MVEKKFFLESKTAELQRIGLRAQIVSFLIQEGIGKGNVLNDPENKNKVVVALSISFIPEDPVAEENKIKKIKTELVEYLNGLSSADNVCYNQFPSDISATNLFDLNNPRQISIVDLSALSSALMLEQTSKGVGAMISSKNELTAVGKSLKNEFTAVGESLKNELQPLKTLPEILEKLRKK